MKWCLILFVLFPRILWSQYHFNFEGGEEEVTGQDPQWRQEQIPADRWALDSLNPICGSYSLKHTYDNPGPGCDYFILHHDPFVDGDSLVFSFRVRHGYDPSSVNNWQVSLLSDVEVDREGSVSITGGIIVGVNFMDSDDLLKIWMVESGEIRELCTTSFNYQEAVGTDEAPLFCLSWQRAGLLTLFHRNAEAGAMNTQIGSCDPEELPEGRSLLVRYAYSAAQDRKLWLDEISLDGHFLADTVPPEIRGCELQGERGIHLQFSERMATPSTDLFSLCPVGGSGEPQWAGCKRPDSMAFHKNNMLLVFPEDLPNREPMILVAQGLCDEDGNCLRDTILIVMRNDPLWGDVVINEVMADPDPGAGEFLGEYVELFNRSEHPVQLEGWTLRVGERDIRIVDSALVINPGGYFLISGVSLPNRGAQIGLLTRDLFPVHAATYRIPLEGPDWKADGGWSLEATDPGLVCKTSELWQFSTDQSGGTPGEVNSVDMRLDDLEPPVYLYHGFGDTGNIYVQYSEPVRFMDEAAWGLVIQPGRVYPDSMVRNDLTGERISAYFPEGILGRDLFGLELPALSDCEGNHSAPVVIQTGKVSWPEAGKVVINEVMYDPEEGRPEYIELFNPSSRCFDLQDLAVDIVDDGATPEHFTFLSGQSRIVGPGAYMAITGDIRAFRAAYGLDLSGSWVEVEDLKSLPGRGGWIYLADRSGNTVDRVAFNDQMHMEGIDNTRGISLERVAWDRPGLDPANWHSAASIVGYATPGSPNSQREPDLPFMEILDVKPKVFSPDNDGFDDLLGISLGSMEQGSVIRLWITDMRGNPVKELANNHIAGPASKYSWNGEDDGGSRVKEGMYVIHLRGIHPVTGRVWNRKCAAGVVYR